MRVVMFAHSHMEYALELGEALSEHEEVMLISPEMQIKRFSGAIGKNLIVYPYQQYRFRSPMNLLTIHKIIKHINMFSPDVIHLQHLFGENPWFDLRFKLLKRKYYFVITVHDVNLHKGDNASIRIPFMYKVDKKYNGQIIVHGENQKKEMIRKYRHPPESVHVLPRGVNSIYKYYKKKEVEEEKHNILFFGRIWEYKGLRYLIKAEPIITKKVPDAKIVIAGRGEGFGKYRRMMVNRDKFKIIDRHIPNEMIPDLFQKSSVVVLPYIDASQSGVVPLAYAFKKPVVITNVGCLPEIVEQGKTGYIVPPRDSEKLAEAIVDLLKNDLKRKKMGQAAYEKTKNELSWDRIAVKTIEIYKKKLCVT